MTTPVMTPSRPGGRPGRASFPHLLHAEWTKFRTVRGWVTGVIVSALVMVLLGVIIASGSHGPGGPGLPLGPDGEAVSDSFYFVHQPLDGNGSITARLTSLTGLVPSGARIRAGQGGTGSTHSGLEPWSKAGIIIKESTRQGSAYAAVMVTGGHGVRMQYNYTHDTAGLPGGVSAASPRWLRLTRTGDALTGYDSADGTHWNVIGTATLAGLPATVQAGLFAASPSVQMTIGQSLGSSTSNTEPTQATGVFDHVSLRDALPSSTWSGDDIGGNADASQPGAVPGQDLGGGFHQAGGSITVAGSGDIAPADEGTAIGSQTIEHPLAGAFAGLIAVIVVATMFITAEYRRGLIRVTLAASPRRGRVLAAKAIVTGAVTFAAGLAAAAVAFLLGLHIMRSNGFFVLPVTPLTEVRVIAGTAALLAAAAVLALGAGALLRSSAGAVTTVIAAIVLPYILATAGVLPAAPSQWLLRVTPAAAFAIQQSVPEYAQLANACTPSQGGCYPLAPWAGFAVLCAWAAAALALAIIVLRRRDA
jgi:ABC-type transport system involved in multi-copper enzyme maturation permease subunit